MNRPTGADPVFETEMKDPDTARKGLASWGWSV